MKNFKFLTAAIALSMLTFISCSKDEPGGSSPDNPVTDKLFSIKSATITYDFVGTLTLYFDNYGAQVCVENTFDMQYVSDERYIWDSSTNKGYHLYTTDKTYQEVTKAEVMDKLQMFFFDEQSIAASGFAKTTETIAGKSCTIYTGQSMGSTVSMGGWSGIYFLMIVDGSDLLRARTFSDAVSADIFKVPADFTPLN